MGKWESLPMQRDYLKVKRKQIILIAFLSSIVIHLGIIVASPDIFLGTGFKTRLRAYKVHLIRPPMKEMMEMSQERHTDLSQIPQEPAEEPKEATISLDIRDSTYNPYATIIKERICQFWAYPLSAQQTFIQGDLLIVFRLDRNGNLVDSRIARSSGYQILDNSAIKAIESAKPFPAFPDTIPVQFLNINASFTYKLKFEQ
jgi:TonB family protein